MPDNDSALVKLAWNFQKKKKFGDKSSIGDMPDFIKKKIANADDKSSDKGKSKFPDFLKKKDDDKPPKDNPFSSEPNGALDKATIGDVVDGGDAGTFTKTEKGWESGGKVYTTAQVEKAVPNAKVKKKAPVGLSADDGNVELSVQSEVDRYLGMIQ